MIVSHETLNSWRAVIQRAQSANATRRTIALIPRRILCHLPPLERFDRLPLPANADSSIMFGLYNSRGKRTGLGTRGLHAAFRARRWREMQFYCPAGFLRDLPHAVGHWSPSATGSIRIKRRQSMRRYVVISFTHESK